MTQAIEPRALAEVGFQLSEFGPFLGQALAAYSSDDARRAMAYMKETFGACTEYTEIEDDGTTYTWRLSALSFPKVGEETFAARISATDIPFFSAIQVDLVVFRRGGVVGYVALSALGPAGTDVATLEAAVRRADAKLLELR